jgi:hypothetical protein
MHQSASLGTDAVCVSVVFPLPLSCVAWRGRLSRSGVARSSPCSSPPPPPAPIPPLQIIHESVYDTVVSRMLAAYASIKPGDPLTPGVYLFFVFVGVGGGIRPAMTLLPSFQVP